MSNVNCVRALHTTLAFSALSIKLNENELIHMDITVCWDGSCCQVRLQIKPKSSSDIFKVFSDLNYTIGGLNPEFFSKAKM